MGFTGKAKNKNSNSISSSEHWGMGFLFVFFPEENPAAIVNKDKFFCSSASSSSSSFSPSSSIRRSSSSLLLARTQSTISICALLVFISLLLFTLSTFEPTIPAIKAQSAPARRFLSQNRLIPDDITSAVGINPKIHRSSVLLSSSWFTKMWKQKVIPAEPNRITATALQGMGNLHRRGTKAMPDLLVCHVVEETTAEELRLYLRLLHRSGLTSKSDTVIIFPSQSLSSRFKSVIQEENDWFLKLIRHYQKLNSTSRRSGSGFDPTPFLAVGKKEAGEPLWGKKALQTNASNSDHAESTRLSYGSVVSFEAADLDPENSLSGFSDHIPMNLRRWACYPLLLGRLRRNFKHVILFEVKNAFLMGDPLGRVRNRTPESVYIYRKPEQLPSKHSRKNSEKTRQQTQSNSAILMGGSRGIRRLSNVMLTSIVKTLMQQKKKGQVADSAILSQLAEKEVNAKNIDFIKSSEIVPVFSPGAVPIAKSSAESAVVQRGKSNFDEFSKAMRKKICASEVDSSVYSSDCQPKNPQI